ncbi:UNVERIFIED_CONTAM: BURP domain-containing protein 16 [Sesamum radiatum]|uniref:BURP domain-containing protein 16 n=1 Tax=Sesamum radiatum TaxID=300843 RepID=A0AAW2QH70_SESRA
MQRQSRAKPRAARSPWRKWWGFAKAALGGTTLLALTSKNTRGSGAEMVIGKMKQYEARKIVACHEAFLPFAAYFCHSLPSTRLYAVEVVDWKAGAVVNTMLAICHMDTSAWPKSHVAFEILKFGPGQGEACHWFTQLDLAWISDESE